jgi:lipopolysaccharide transport system permease protein
MNIRDKYLGSRLGTLWAIANPVMMLCIFTFVFGYVYKAKLPGAETSLAYVTWLVSGYGPWLSISEAISAGAISVVAAAGLVKNLAFKTEVLPIAAGLSAIVPLVVSLCFTALIMIIDGNRPTLHILIVPAVIITQFLFVIGVCLFLSAAVVFMRDISFVLPNLLMMLLFFTPIFYRIENVPPVLRVFAIFNPIYILAESYRQPLVFHQAPNWYGLAYVVAVACAMIIFGLRTFRRLKGYFTSAL